jgi:toxin-antitoxin system PIN domain toxin
VWLALSSPDHEHFHSAWDWYRSLPEGAILLFCRVTQLGLLRLLTTRAAMGLGILTQAEAWQVYDRWLESGGAEFVEETDDLEAHFRSNTNSTQASPKEWADAYLAAFAFTLGSQLVTFDRALAGKVKGAMLLG